MLHYLLGLKVIKCNFLQKLIQSWSFLLSLFYSFESWPHSAAYRYVACIFIFEISNSHLNSLLHLIVLTFFRPQRSWSKVMFLHLSLILFTGRGCLPQCMLGYIPLGGDPPGRHQVDTLPPRKTPPGSSAYWEIRATSGRYASYWNAYLWTNEFA